MDEKRTLERPRSLPLTDAGPDPLSEAADPARQGRDNRFALAVFDERGDPCPPERLRADVAAVTRAFRARNRGGAKTLYVWYDAQAGHLRASAVHAGRALPFACAVDRDAALDEVIADTRAELASLAARGRLAVYAVRLEGPDAAASAGGAEGDEVTHG